MTFTRKARTVGSLGVLAILLLHPSFARADHNENVTALATFILYDEAMEQNQDELEDKVLDMAKKAANAKCEKLGGRVQSTNFEEIFPRWNGTAGCHHSGEDSSGFHPEQATAARCTGSYTVRCRFPDITAATDDFKKPPTQLRDADGGGGEGLDGGGASRAGD